MVPLAAPLGTLKIFHHIKMLLSYIGNYGTCNCICSTKLIRYKVRITVLVSFEIVESVVFDDQI